MTRPLTQKEFVDRSGSLHRDDAGNPLYDYSDSKYNGRMKKVKIYCNKHQEFYWQTAADHLGGCGCPKCGRSSSIRSHVLSTDKFVQRALEIHKDLLYNYDLVVYENIKKKILIKCNHHNAIFEQTPNDHLNGQGCPLCAGHLRRTINEFKQQASNTHRRENGTPLYNYDNTIYNGAHKKLKIYCYQHGEFEQEAGAHLNGQGCPFCCNSRNISIPEIECMDVLNISKENRQFKITIDNKRFKVDGYNPITNTVVEFMGDYWHGNPQKYNSSDINPKNKKTFGELYEETLRRRKLILAAGYNIFEIWLSDWGGLKKLYKKNKKIINGDDIISAGTLYLTTLKGVR